MAGDALSAGAAARPARGEVPGLGGRILLAVAAPAVAGVLAAAALLLTGAAAGRPAAALLALLMAVAVGAAFGYRLLAGSVAEPLGTLLERLRDPGTAGSGTTAEGPLAHVHAALAAGAERVRERHARAVARAVADTEARLEAARRAQIEELGGELAASARELDLAQARASRLALQLEERGRDLEQALKNVSALNRVGVALGAELDIDRLVQLIINVSVKGLRVEIGQIMLVAERTGRLEMRAWTGLGRGFDPALGVEPDEGVSGTVARTGRRLLVRRVDGTEGISPESRFGFRRRSVLCVPIRVKERLLGTIELTNKKGEEGFSEEDARMLESIATQAGVAIENAKLYRDLQTSYLETIRALVQAVEEKDRYTRGHSERVTTFSEKIARRMGLGERQVQMLQYAGVLHDIGKIGIDLAILQKRERLTEAEYDVVKHHPLVGERIIRQIGFLGGALAAVVQHHERYDGGGYPQGLTGEAMTIEARILAVADAYDAMITERPYRKPLAKCDAVAELRRCSGTQFDPLVVEQFLEVLESDPEILKLEERLTTVGT